MDTQPEDRPAEESVSSAPVQEVADPVVEPAPEPTPEPKKEPRKTRPTATRKGTTAKKQRPKKAAVPVARRPLTGGEVRETVSEVKSEIVLTVVEPIQDALIAWSETIRKTVGGALDGLLSRRRKN